MNPNALVLRTRIDSLGAGDAGGQSAFARLREQLANADCSLQIHVLSGFDVEQGRQDQRGRPSDSDPEGGQSGTGQVQLFVDWAPDGWATIRKDWQTLAEHDRLYLLIQRKLIAFVGRLTGIVTGDGSRSAITRYFGLGESEIQCRITGQGDKRAPFGEIDAHFAPELAPRLRADCLVLKGDDYLAADFVAELGTDAEFLTAVAEIDEASRLPESNDIEREPDAPTPGLAALQRLSSEVRADIVDHTVYFSHGDRKGTPTEAVVLKRVKALAERTLMRFREHRDHGFHATIVEELCRGLYADQVGCRHLLQAQQEIADQFSAGRMGSRLVDLLCEAPPNGLQIAAQGVGSLWAEQMLQALTQRNQQLAKHSSLDFRTDCHDRRDREVDTAQERNASIDIAALPVGLQRYDPMLGPDLGYIYPRSAHCFMAGLLGRG